MNACHYRHNGVPASVAETVPRPPFFITQRHSAPPVTGNFLVTGERATKLTEAVLGCHWIFKQAIPDVLM